MFAELFRSCTCTLSLIHLSHCIILMKWSNIPPAPPHLVFPVHPCLELAIAYCSFFFKALDLHYLDTEDLILLSWIRTAKLDPHQNQKGVYNYKSVSHFSLSQVKLIKSRLILWKDIVLKAGGKKVRNTGQTVFCFSNSSLIFKMKEKGGNL